VWIITAWQRILPEVTVKGFKKCFISNAMDETDDNVLWNGSEEDGNIRSEHEEDEDMTVNVEMVRLIGKGRI
jgi:hypothetical protein